MKQPTLWMVVFVLLLSSCNKSADNIISKEKHPSTVISSGFIQYTIPSGQHFADQNVYKAIETSEMKFIVKFDSSAIYQTVSAENQDDINKLYGFSDNNANHHQYSARIGWRWSNNALRLFAYTYNENSVTSRELTTVQIGTEIHCSIKITGNSYLFSVNDITQTFPRTSTTTKASGYQLYPYFGGDEPAPHNVNIWIKSL